MEARPYVVCFSCGNTGGMWNADGRLIIAPTECSGDLAGRRDAKKHLCKGCSRSIGRKENEIVAGLCEKNKNRCGLSPHLL